MRKRKTLKKGEDESDASEPVAEPEEFQDSGEDWTPDADAVIATFIACIYNIHEPALYTMYYSLSLFNSRRFCNAPVIRNCINKLVRSYVDTAPYRAGMIIGRRNSCH